MAEHIEINGKDIFTMEIGSALYLRVGQCAKPDTADFFNQDL
jgi:hypothetical protein